MLFMLGVLLLLILLGGLEVWAVAKWKGMWRAVAILPVAFITFAVIRIIVDTHRNPSSHSMLPFEMISLSVLGLAVLAVFALLRAVAVKLGQSPRGRALVVLGVSAVTILTGFYVWSSYSSYGNQLRGGVGSRSRLEPAYRLSSADARLGDARSEYDRWVSLGDAALLNAEFGSAEKATAYANELLGLTRRYESDWNCGNAIHKGHISLGLVALKAGDIDGAKSNLLAAATKGSPQLESFGPNMVLARELLNRGERAAVLEYLDRCSGFWHADHGKISEWEAVIKEGSVPDFGENLLY